MREFLRRLRRTYVLWTQGGTRWTHDPVKLTGGDMVQNKWVTERVNHETLEITYTLVTPKEVESAMERLDRSNIVAIIFGITVISCFVWATSGYPSPKIYKSSEGRQFVCNPTLSPDELKESLTAPIAERGESGNCVFIDRFQR